MLLLDRITVLKLWVGTLGSKLMTWQHLLGRILPKTVVLSPFLQREASPFYLPTAFTKKERAGRKLEREYWICAEAVPLDMQGVADPNKFTYLEFSKTEYPLTSPYHLLGAEVNDFPTVRFWSRSFSKENHCRPAGLMHPCPESRVGPSRTHQVRRPWLLQGEKAWITTGRFRLRLKSPQKTIDLDPSRAECSAY